MIDEGRAPRKSPTACIAAARSNSARVVAGSASPSNRRRIGERLFAMRDRYAEVRLFIVRLRERLETRGDLRVLRAVKLASRASASSNTGIARSYSPSSFPGVPPTSSICACTAEADTDARARARAALEQRPRRAPCRRRCPPVARVEQAEHEVGHLLGLACRAWPRRAHAAMRRPVREHRDRHRRPAARPCGDGRDWLGDAAHEKSRAVARRLATRRDRMAGPMAAHVVGERLGRCVPVAPARLFSVL